MYTFIRAGKKANIEGAQLLKGSNTLYVEEKFDGSRFGLEKDSDGKWHAISRNGIDRINNIPYIEEQLQELFLPNNTVLDCEVIVFHSDRQKRWELSRSVMGTNDYDSKVLEAHLLIFDVQMYDGLSYLKHSYLERRRKLAQIFGEIEFELQDTYKQYRNLAIPRSWSIRYLEELWKTVVEKGNGEGVMLKSDKIRNYGKDWTKVKKEDTADAFILGATPGKGKYSGQIGALELAVYNGGTIWPIGKCSGMDDAVRLEMTELALQGNLKDLVIEVKYNDVTKNKKLRHPRFMRWRPEKKKEECLLSQL